MTDTMTLAETLNAIADPALSDLVRATQATIAQRRDLDRIDAERDANKAKYGYWLSDAEIEYALKMLTRYGLWEEIPYEDPR